ncbi:MAG: hypothetical protein WCH44_12120 [Betaproteobacteria bacterium]
MRSLIIRAVAIAGLFIATGACAMTPIGLTAGWNLVANSDATPIDVAVRLGDSTKITTVWKWNSVSNRWAFYAPSMIPASLAAYAQGKGYDVLSSIASKEGFWVNAAAPAMVTDPLALPPAPGTAPVKLLASDIRSGWNLLGSGDNKNPSQLNTGLSSSLGAAGKGLVTAWSWDAPTSRWKFFAPTLEAQGGTALADYISAKGFNSFNTAPAATDGFWLNVGAATTPITPPAALTQAKAFVTALRSNAMALNASDISLQTELQAMADDLKTHTAPIAISNIDTLRLIHREANLWVDVMQKGSKPFAANTYFYSSFNVVESLCSFYSDSNYMVFATGTSDAKFLACSTNPPAADVIWATDANGVAAPCKAVGDWCYTVWATRVRLEPDTTDSGKFTVYSITRETRFVKAVVAYSFFDTASNFMVSGAPSCPANTICTSIASTTAYTRNNYGAALPGNVTHLASTRDSAGELTSLSILGELSPGFTVTTNPTSMFDPVSQQWISRRNQVGTVLGDKNDVAMSLALSHLAGVDKLALSGSVDLIKGGAMESRMAIADGSYLMAKPDGSGGYSAQDRDQELLLKLSAGTPASSFTGDIKISAFQPDASATTYTPTQVAFSGILQRNGVTVVDGSFTAALLNYTSYDASRPASASNVLTGRTGFSGHIIVPTRPTLQLDLSATAQDSGAGSSTVTSSGQYVQGLLTINLSGTATAASKVMTIESTDGVLFVIDKSQSTYPLTVRGSLVGVYSPSSKMLTYSDNSYEQF